MTSPADLPVWAQWLTAALVVLGAAFAAIGSFGLLRMPTFFRRIHTPTLGATVGVWCVMLANIVYFSAQGGSLFVHAVLISLFVALTAPVTTIFLMRAALFRERQRSNPDVPPTVASVDPALVPAAEGQAGAPAPGAGDRSSPTAAVDPAVSAPLPDDPIQRAD
ncbi:MAG: Na+/H+ antiporter subunit G [Comamonadaceae bacterium]|nr:MAG: Na+/H+ antiporter subunit G [Comamonadaceae bacterium]